MAWIVVEDSLMFFICFERYQPQVRISYCLSSPMEWLRTLMRSLIYLLVFEHLYIPRLFLLLYLLLIPLVSSTVSLRHAPRIVDANACDFSRRRQMLCCVGTQSVCWWENNQSWLTSCLALRLVTLAFSSFALLFPETNVTAFLPYDPVMVAHVALE